MNFSRTRIILIVVAGVLIAVVGLMVKADRSAETFWRAQRDALHAEPVVVALLERGNARCQKQVTSYIWACGVLLEMEGLDQAELCSTRQEPRFAGNLDDDPMGLQWQWQTSYAVPGFPLENYKVFIRGVQRSTWLYPVSGPPDDIPEEPLFPKFDRDTLNLLHNLPAVWAKHDSMPVGFHFSSSYPREHSETLPSSCQLKSMHPKLPIAIGIMLPCTHLQNWREILVDANKRITAGVLEIDKGAQCEKPPKSVRFSVNPFDDDKIRALRNWLNTSPQHGP